MAQFIAFSDKDPINLAEVQNFATDAIAAVQVGI